jgi:hypothetical protein
MDKLILAQGLDAPFGGDDNRKRKKCSDTNLSAAKRKRNSWNTMLREPDQAVETNVSGASSPNLMLLIVQKLPRARRQS